MNERRGLPRRHLMFHLRAFDADTGEYVGNLFDISHEGLMLVGENHLPVGEPQTLKVNLPFEVLERGQISFTATPAWLSNDVQPTLYDIGLGDLRMDDDDRAVLERLIKDYSMAA